MYIDHATFYLMPNVIRFNATMPYDVSNNAKILMVDLDTVDEGKAEMESVAYVNQIANQTSMHGEWESLTFDGEPTIEEDCQRSSNHLQAYYSTLTASYIVICKLATQKQQALP
jgi:hypothetical protein